jgi:hypothetical protein
MDRIGGDRVTTDSRMGGYNKFAGLANAPGLLRMTMGRTQPRRPTPEVAMDGKARKSFDERFPMAARIKG